jgi:hypothetical protein
MLVQEVCRPSDNLVASFGIIAFPLLATVVFRDHIGAVQRVIQTAPAGIGGIQGITGIHYGYDQLWPGHYGDLVIHVGCGNSKILTFRNEITNVGQKRLVFISIDELALPFPMPGVDLALQLFPFRQQSLVPGRQVIQNLRKRAPKRGRPHPGAR